MKNRGREFDSYSDESDYFEQKGVFAPVKTEDPDEAYEIFRQEQIDNEKE